MAKQYETVIGLEVHIELATKTKIFCGCSTEFGGAPNTHTCPVCTGMPGALPVLNRQVVEYAMAIGLATNCRITQVCKFDRKNYFYPDNPQNYQISQLYLPIARDGYVEIERTWNPGDVVELNFPMEVRRIQANAKVAADEGLMAIERGPIMYCLEGIDTEDILFCTPRLCLAVPSSIVIIDTLLADASPASIGEIER